MPAGPVFRLMVGWGKEASWVTSVETASLSLRSPEEEVSVPLPAVLIVLVLLLVATQSPHCYSLLGAEAQGCRW